MKPHSLENNTDTYFLTLPAPCISESCIKTKIYKIKFVLLHFSVVTQNLLRHHKEV